MQQYKGKQAIEGMVTSITEQIQELEDVIYALDDGRMLFNGTTYPSVGVQLDNIGEIVGIKRNGLTDEQYLVLILGTIAQNNTDTTIPTILFIINLIFQPQGLHYYEVYPAGIGFDYFDTGLDPALYLLGAQIIQKSLAAGVSLEFIVQYDETNPFAFIDLYDILPNFPNGSGFDDLVDPGQGGLFSTLIYGLSIALIFTNLLTENGYNLMTENGVYLVLENE